MFPGNIDTPGYAEENRTKPKVALEVDSSDKPTAPDVLATQLIYGDQIVSYTGNLVIYCFAVARLGVQRGDFHISPDMLSNIFRSSTIGATPHHNVLLDGLYAVAGWVRQHFVVFLWLFD